MTPRFANISNFYIVLLLFGFFSIGLLGNIFPGTSRAITIPYRGLILVFSLYLIITGFLNNRLQFPKGKLLLFLIFWLLYTFRVIIDLYFRNIQATVFNESYEYILNVIAICFLPSLAIMYAINIDFNRVLKWSYWILFISLITTLFLNLNLDSSVVQKNYGRYSGGGALSTISYGHQGVTMSLLSLFLLSKGAGWKRNIFYISGLLLGLFVMYLAGSKSPLVALLICTAFFYLSAKGIFKGLMILAILIAPFIIFGNEILDYLSQYGGTFIDRIDVLLNRGDEGRDMLFTEGFSQFVNSPVLGNAFVLQGPGSREWNGFYPHNIIIESLMSMGIVGGIIIVLLIIQGFNTCHKLIISFNANAWVGLLFIQYTLLAMFSNAIYTNHYFWYYYVLVLAAQYAYKN